MKGSIIPESGSSLMTIHVNAMLSNLTYQVFKIFTKKSKKIVNLSSRIRRKINNIRMKDVYLPHDESSHCKRAEDRKETQHGSRVKAGTTKRTVSY